MLDTCTKPPAKGASVTRDRIRRIVVGVDGSPQSRVALQWAVREARRSGCVVVDAVLAYGSGLAWIDVGSDAEPLIVKHSAGQAKETLHEAIDDAELPPSQDVRVNPLTIMGDPAAVLPDVARDADLLVVGSRGRGGFTGLLFGSVSQRCAERSECPVVIVRSDHASVVDESVGRRVVVGVDGSSQSRRALEWAVEVSDAGDEVGAVLAYDRGVAWVVADPDIEMAAASAREDLARSVLDASVGAVAAPPDGAHVTAQVVPGEPWRVLVEQSEPADLLVVGRRGHGGFAGLLLGSVSRRCAERSACPVAIVPTPHDTEAEGGAGP
jgi:nucleotide-binding universal stress UspA family protein